MGPLAALGDVVSVVGGAVPAQLNQPVVTPGGVNPLSGAVRQTRRDYSGSVRLLGEAADALKVGDLLVPATGGAPALLLKKDHEGLAFSDGFIALRPLQPWTGTWLWACLSSATGVRVREGSITGTTLKRLTPATLLATPVPVRADVTAILPALRSMSNDVPAVEENANVASSWWRVATLAATGDWHAQLSLRNPSLLVEGTRLGDLAQVTSGHLPHSYFSTPRPDTLPVRHGRSVDGRNVRMWATPDAAPRVHPGDIVVVGVGHRGRVSVSDEECLAGPGVLVVRANEPALAPALASYLSSESAQELRASLIQGLIPHLTPALLRQFPVPENVLSSVAMTEPKPVTPLPLAQRLEQLLWG
ncbi:hypothetical protein [Micromonospora tulbaghiae]|uniref:hypothetical protein n=1 Tax=Micromonospora tulbaghiae TaxID=479978 RepID=UPI0034401CBA